MDIVKPGNIGHRLRQYLLHVTTPPKAVAAANVLSLSEAPDGAEMYVKFTHCDCEVTITDVGLEVRAGAKNWHLPWPSPLTKVSIPIEDLSECKAMGQELCVIPVEGLGEEWSSATVPGYFAIWVIIAMIGDQRGDQRA